MILDYDEAHRVYLIKVQRQADGVGAIQELMRDHGLDLSIPLSSPQEAVLFTREPYAAVTFHRYATPAAMRSLSGLIQALDASRKETSDRNFAIPAGKELWPYQRGTLEYALGKTHVLVGDEPGLGKTPIALAYANEIQAQRVLIICPAAIRIQWARRIAEWSTIPWSSRSTHLVLNGHHGIHPRANFQIISYDLARTDALGRSLAALDFDLLILDEAHYLKTIDSRRTRAIFGGGENRTFAPLVERSERVLALTGTPLPNRPREAYTLARSLCFDSIDWMSEDRFNARFNPISTGVTQNGKVWVDERSGRHAELQNRLRANFMVRHLKKDVLKQLDLPVYDLVVLEETRAIRQALDAESLLDIDVENFDGADLALLGHVSVVRRQMGVAMAPSIADYVKVLFDGGETKLVLFAWHVEVLNILEERLARYHPVRIDGSTGPKQREHAVHTFEHDPKCEVIIGNLLSMGTGIDGLQNVASHAIIAEPDWVPANNVQACDRLNRFGQQRTVQCDLMVAPGSIAEKILASAVRKLGVTTKALDQQW